MYFVIFHLCLEYLWNMILKYAPLSTHHMDFHYRLFFISYHYWKNFVRFTAIRATNEYTIVGLLLFPPMQGDCGICVFSRQYKDVFQFKGFPLLPTTIGSILESMPLKGVCYFSSLLGMFRICALIQAIYGCVIVGTLFFFLPLLRVSWSFCEHKECCYFRRCWEYTSICHHWVLLLPTFVGSASSYVLYEARMNLPLWGLYFMPLSGNFKSPCHLWSRVFPSSERLMIYLVYTI